MNTTTIRNMTAGEFEQHINALVVVDANGLTTTIRAGYGCTRPAEQTALQAGVITNEASISMFRCPFSGPGSA